jgi:predicted membrane protein
MDYEQECSHNRMMLKRCKKFYNAASVFYLVVYGFSIFTSVYFMILALFDPVYLKLIFINIGILAAGFLSTYLKNDILPAAASALALIDLFCSRFAPVFTPLVIIFSVLTIMVNRKYKWLEQQDGFPYFNTRFRDQELDRVQWNIKDPYQQNYEEIKKRYNNSGDMDEL